MAREFKRTDRLAIQIQKNLARLITQEVKDPRIGLVTISDVRLSRDLAHAKVYVTILGGSDDIEQSMKGLHKATPFLRTLLAREINIRAMPQLHFIYDNSLVEGQRLSSIIDKAIADDETRHNREDNENNTDSEDNT